MANKWSDTLASIEPNVMKPCGVMIVLDDEAGNGCTAPGDLTNGMWVNCKASALPPGAGCVPAPDRLPS